VQNGLYGKANYEDGLVVGFFGNEINLALSITPLQL